MIDKKYVNIALIVVFFVSLFISLNSVIFEGDEKYIGKLVDVKITKTNRNTLFGIIDENKNMRAA